MVLPEPLSIPTAKIALNPANFRKVYDLDALVVSIRDFGILHPPGVWHDLERGCYHAIYGNRRIAAAQRLELPEIYARVYPGTLEPGQADLLQLVENLQRIDLKPSEEAHGYRQLMDSQDLNASGLASLVSVANSTVTKKLALLKLIPTLLASVDRGVLPETAGYEIASLPEAAQRELAANLTGRETREEIRDAIRAVAIDAPKKPAPKKPTLLRRGPLGLTYGGEDKTLKALIGELEALLRDAKHAQTQGVSDLAAFSKSLKPLRKSV